MPLSMPSHGERDAPARHLYLIFDDWPWGYSIRKLKLPRNLPPLEPRRPKRKCLPPPCICLEATRHLPTFFAAVGTNIIAAHPRNDFGNAPVPDCILPIFDVRSRGIRFGPGLTCPGMPILITVGDEVFSLGWNRFRMLSMKPACHPSEWSWRSNCSLPFADPPNYVHALDLFVGLSKAPDTCGHLCFCRKLCGDDVKVWPGKENLFSKDPAECRVGAKLVYLGGSEPGFCLVECVSITEGKSVNRQLEECDQLVKRVDEEGGTCGELDQLKKNVDEEDGASGSMQESGELDELKKFVEDLEGGDASGSMHCRYLYRLTTFSLSFDHNGDLTTGETCVVQCYKVPEEVSDEAIYNVRPCAFWL